MSMLILSRYVGEAVCVGDVAIWVTELNQNEVSFYTSDADIDLLDSIPPSKEGEFTLKAGETFEIESKSATVTVVEVRGDKVRIGIECPQNMPVHRKEVYDAIQAINWQKRNFELKEGDCVCVGKNGVTVESIESDTIQMRVRKVVDPYSLRDSLEERRDKEFGDKAENNRLLEIGDSFSPEFSMTSVKLLSIENHKATVEFEYPENRERVEPLDEFYKRLDREEEEAQKSPFGISRVAILERRANQAASIESVEKATEAPTKPFWKRLLLLFSV